MVDNAAHARAPTSALGCAIAMLVILSAVTVVIWPAGPTEGQERQPTAGGPTLLHDSISLRKVAAVGGGIVKLARNPLDGQLYFLNPAVGVFRIEAGEPAPTVQIVSAEAFEGGWPAGLAFGPDGALFVVLNSRVGQNRTQAIIRRGVGAAAGQVTWQTLASTDPYPLSNTPFDHLFNGIVVSPDGQWVIVNSGSRTDHGEVQSSEGAFPDTREVGLTAKLFRLPADGVGLVLPNDEAALAGLGVVFASGTRNAYDPEFAPNGDLFAGDNGPDADYPDEINWLRPGRHYGFPWRFGDQDNPQQFPDYDAATDARLQPDFFAVQTGTYRNDPDYPPPPGPFADPVANLGPAAAHYRDQTGRQRDAAAEGMPLYSVTPHRSPLGLVFAVDGRMPADLAGSDRRLSAFILSWGAAGGTLTDTGQDLLHLGLARRGDAYFATTTQIARDFNNPIDAVMIENRLYILEFGADGAIWELAFR